MRPLAKRLLGEVDMAAEQGLQLHIEEFESANTLGRSPIVLLHEGLGSVAGWGLFPTALARATRRKVIAYDRLGYGRSPDRRAPWPTTFLIDEARTLASLITERVDAAPILVGHSDGASIALAYPHARGDALAPLGIVSIAAHVFVEQLSIDEIARLMANRGKLLESLRRQHRHAEALLENWAAVWTAAGSVDWNLDAELAAVTCPVLAVQGVLDRFGSDEQLQRIAAKASGSVELKRIAEVDHWPHREATEDLLGMITAFCDSVDSSGKGI